MSLVADVNEKAVYYPGCSANTDERWYSSNREFPPGRIIQNYLMLSPMFLREYDISLVKEVRISQ